MSEPDVTAQEKCEQTGCTYNQDGRCLEGLNDPEKCPHIVGPPRLRVPIGSKGTDEDPNDADPSANWITLADGNELTAVAASRITSGTGARVVVLAGEPDGGKTTITASLYEQFSHGSFASYDFSGSDTIVALERICYLSRISSGRPKPDTDRTKGLEPRFFHFALSRTDGTDAPINLLLTDVSGEAYKRALNNEEDAKKLTFILRADKFMLVLDGERLADKNTRQDAIQRGLLVLRSLHQAGVLRAACSIRIVISKLDILKSEVADASTGQFMEHCRELFEHYANGQFKDFAIMEIAARPENELVPFGYGLETLVEDWLKEGMPEVPDSRILRSSAPTSNSVRESELFLWRHLGK
jgi:hypothetical protein